ncbi:tail fiber protein [Acinetobacter phage Acj9]|uniref:Uncharacterized protein n=1 Tax=Acinetobacter phage Acj9 TaxID=760939 RepID=E5EPT0_9CAUD|nr:tail fiber protein [Acinetobacter phage Acj9]ADG60046.1 conserved hypothetical protein [Acinetobacter phage Acj9]
MTTITRALVTLKHGKDQFTEALREARFSGVFRNGTEISTGTDTAKFKEASRKTVQSLTDKLEAEFELRRKVNKANATTMVKIGDKEMTIADALTYRTHILPQLKALHQRLVKDLAANRALYTNTEREYDMKLSKSQNDEDLKVLLEKREKPSILDTEAEIAKLKTQIDFFGLEFDAILTEKNPLIVID